MSLKGQTRRNLERMVEEARSKPNIQYLDGREIEVRHVGKPVYLRTPSGWRAEWTIDVL